jgi:NAD(P)-dependent dehydrogenase (short-subunit alcohol dehydrogenase family)
LSDHRQVVITGASSGIGAALTRALAQEGLDVYACARRAERLNEVTENNSVAFGYRCDVSDEEQVEEFVARVAERTSTVDVLINCAGGFGAIGSVMQTDSRQWLHTLEVNLYGTYLMVKHLVPLMRSERSPSIVNFSGGGAFNPLPHYSAYAVSKSAVVRLTETLAVELAPMGIRVNAVAPGFVDTEIHLQTLAAGPEKVADRAYQETQRKLTDGSGVPIDLVVDCVRFLMSEEAKGLSGKTISASFDPWRTAELAASIPRINDSDLYTMQRINLVHLPQDPLRADLETAPK